MILHIGKKEINLIGSLLVVDKMDSLKQEWYNSLESAEQSILSLFTNFYFLSHFNNFTNL